MFVQLCVYFLFHVDNAKPAKMFEHTNLLVELICTIKKNMYILVEYAYIQRFAKYEA